MPRRLRIGLPMYDLSEVRVHHDVLFDRFRDRLEVAGVRNLPRALDRFQPLEDHWSANDLLFSQICGIEVSRHMKGRFNVVAAPQFVFPGCENGSYRSHLVVRASDPARTLDDLLGRRLAINSWRSHSGCSSLIELFAPLCKRTDCFSEILVTGAHEDSIRAIKSERVDFAAVDCVTYALLMRHRPGFLQGTRSLGLTKPYLAPPYITPAQTPPSVVDILRDAWLKTLSDPETLRARIALGLDGANVVDNAEYEQLEQPYRAGDAHNYQELSTNKGGNYSLCA